MACKASPKKSPARRAAKRAKAVAQKRGSARKTGARKTTARPAAAKLPRSRRNTGTSWSAAEEKELRLLIKGNTPTRVIGLKLGRSEASIRSKVQKLNLSLMPPNRSPYNRA